MLTTIPNMQKRDDRDINRVVWCWASNHELISLLNCLILLRDITHCVAYLLLRPNQCKRRETVICPWISSSVMTPFYHHTLKLLINFRLRVNWKEERNGEGHVLCHICCVRRKRSSKVVDNLRSIISKFCSCKIETCSPSVVVIRFTSRR